MSMYVATTCPEVSEREKRHSEMVRKMAPECIVLLKNDGVLPLKGAGKVALFGNGARRTVKGGTGSGDVNVRENITIEQGLMDAGFVITTGSWLDREDAALDAEHAVFEQECAEKAKAIGMDPIMFMVLNPVCPKAMVDITDEDIKNSDTDTAVYVVGRNSGEGADRLPQGGDYLLSDMEIENLKKVSGAYEKTIVLLNIGGVIDTAPLREIEGLNAVVLSGQLGNMTGAVTADLLLGKAVPSGRLTDTWAMKYEDYASSKTFSSNDSDDTDEYYEEGIYTGYRYFDTFNVTPAFPFGYGLNYTTFETEVQETEVSGTELSVTVRVKNTGDVFNGREVVQLYVSAPDGELEKPYQELKAFCKTRELKPQEEEQMTMTVQLSSLASYSAERAAWILERGTYYVRIGSDSRHTKVVLAMTLSETVVTEQCRNLFIDPEGKCPELSKKGAVPFSYETEETEKKEAKVIAIDPKAFTTKVVSYSEMPEELKDTNPGHVITMDEVLSGEYTLEELTAQLTDEELTYLCIGNNVAIKNSNVVGNASKGLPGSAGESSTIILESRNVKPFQMPDGPAGLRLTPEFVENEDGSFTATSAAFSGSGLKVEKTDQEIKGIKHYQYCTAVPIAMALASSWNMELLETCGDIVGTEMEEFKATLWLAPGMNNHRNPLCGRNFEYYSEDPLLTGLCAAFDTKGVQKHIGTGTTVKHFACNNQENNRMGSNAHIPERALREIYLRSFMITVKEAQPMGIMSSYNLINGTHAANNKDLLTRSLRDEWGYKGLVMTDWLTTSDMILSSSGAGGRKYERSHADLCVYAGNDLTMPGIPTDVTGILEARKAGTLSKAELQLSAKRVLNVVMRSDLYEGAKAYSEEFPGECVTFSVSR